MDSVIIFHIHLPVCACVCLALSPFPTVADAIQSELEEYKQSEEEVKRLKTAMVSSYVACIAMDHSMVV